ncbi:DUF2947 domain-containing protein [Colwellia ponticola]|uniref:DUF2947 family protein n=1 Tax=Colwellia ponticola TaxID=2304625 RepID=A0A8H2JLQ2_9GAMM|nr:DUF2947 domain-containing protein [Colwellia ponticola]RGP39618.1 hypothetical protein BPTFM16_02735 [Altererythrobacter insulae]TMM43321.1 DUF2947 family protein [Colwellia ponticola]
MNYLPLESLKNAWIFKHKSLPIAEKDLSKIKPMSVERANIVWDTFISRQVDHPDFFKKGDWPADKNNWLEQGKWEGLWDSNEPALPELITKHLDWDQNTVVYYCSSRDNVIETSWLVFTRCWKNFLFIDDGPILVGKKRQQTVQFTSNGYFKVGQKPATN